MTKNNKALRAALVLCVLALFCAAFVGATFAKYVTDDNAADTARAAKWGVSVSMGGSLFGADYTSNTVSTDPDALVAATANKVSATESTSVRADDGAAKIVAPGTKSDKGIIIDLNGKPEVQYEVYATTTGNNEDIFLGAGTWGTMVPAPWVTADNFVYTDDGVLDNDYYTLDGTTYSVATAFNANATYYELNDMVDLAAKYYPIIWSVANEGTEDTVAIASSTNANGLSAVADALVAALNNPVIDGLANNQLDAKYTLTWEWAFDGQNNGADTILGNLIALNADAVAVYLDGDDFVKATDDGVKCNLTVSFDIAVTVEQLN